MPVYDVYFVDQMANPFEEFSGGGRPVMRNIEGNSKKHVRALFKQFKKNHPRKFKNLTISEIKKVRD